MEKFLRFIFRTTTTAIERAGYERAIKDILVFKDKIYTNPVTLLGDQKTLSNCTFLGNEFGLKIESLNSNVDVI